MSTSDTTTSTDRPGPLPRPVPGADGRNPWAFLRTLSTPTTADTDVPERGAERDWTEEGRLDELFSAWAEAALSADVIADRRFMEEHAPSVAPAPAAVVATGAAESRRPEPRPAEAVPVGAVTVPEPVVRRADQLDGHFVTDLPLATDQPVAPAVEETAAVVPAGPVRAWAPGDDDILPRARPGRRRRR